MERSTKASADEIEQQLAELLDQEIFEPPAEFREKALIQDESVYEEAGRDPEAWWAKQSEELLDWAQPWDTVLDESDAPFYKWFVGGKLNASHQALDRHVEAGRGDRVAFHWRGEEGEERDVTYAELLDQVERLANVLRERGVEPRDVVGITALAQREQAFRWLRKQGARLLGPSDVRRLVKAARTAGPPA